MTNDKAIEIVTDLINANIAFQLSRKADGYTQFVAFGKDAVAMHGVRFKDAKLEISSEARDLNAKYYAKIVIQPDGQCQLCGGPSGGGEHNVCEYEEQARSEAPRLEAVK